MGKALRPRRLLFFVFLIFGLFVLFSSQVSATASLTELTNMTGEAGSNWFGYRVASGDFNGDDYADWAVGAYGYESNKGRVYVYYGGATINNNADVIITGEAGNDKLGASVASAGDVNNDGYDDIIVGAQGYSAGSKIGRVYIFFGGASMDNTADVVMDGESANDYFGHSVASAGDINNDGYDDIIVGAQGYNAGGSTGRAYLYLGGASMDNTADVILTGETAGDTFSQSLSSAGDVNNDGYNDVLIGADCYDSDRGKVYVYLGGASMDTTVDLTIEGEETSNDFGFATGSGDVNGDGYSDIIVGAMRANSGNGRVYIFFGGASMDGAVDVVLNGEGGSFGRDNTPVGDINNDGYADVAVGAMGYNSNSGRVYIFFGGASMDNTVDIVTDGAADMLGFYQFFVNDVDGDGWKEILIGAPRHNGYQGRAYLDEITHGSPSVSVNGLGNTHDTTPTMTGTATDTGVNVGGVQSSVDSGAWTDCSASGGAFDSESEPFSCTLSSLSDGSHSVRVRSKDANSIYLPSSLYGIDSFTVDTALPASFDLISPGHEEYTQDTRPTFKWKAASIPDTGSGISHYKLEVLYESGGGFIVDSIPSSGTADNVTEKYIIKYEGFSDSDNTNNYISLQTKSSSSWGECGGELKSGTNNWSVRAIDQAGNEKEESRIVYLGTSPYVTATPTPTPTPTLISVRRVTPTPTIIPTPVITPTPFITPSPTPTSRPIIPPLLSRLETKILEIKILHEEKIPAVTEEEKKKIREEGYQIQFKVLDNQGRPLKGIKVILYSAPKEAYTDEQGIALFTQVEPGEHRVLIAYGNQEAEQKLDLQGEVLEFHYDLQVKEARSILTSQVLILSGFFFLIMAFLTFLFFKKRLPFLS